VTSVSPRPRQPRSTQYTSTRLRRCRHGVIDITDDAITIGGKGRTGSLIPDLTIDRLHVVTATGLHPFEIGIK